METSEEEGGEDEKGVEEIPNPSFTSYAYSQGRLRGLIIDFFHEEEKKNRLKALLGLHPDIGHRLMFFVSKYAKNKLYNLHGIPRCPTEMYKNELRSTNKEIF